MITVGSQGGMMGPPTWGTVPLTIGQVCMSPSRAAGGIEFLSYLENRYSTPTRGTTLLRRPPSSNLVNIFPVTCNPLYALTLNPRPRLSITYEEDCVFTVAKLPD